jgi:arabinose-5-phosphate isomerase
MSDHISTGKFVIKAEAESLMALAEKLDNRFSQAVECILATSGRVILAGMGKSGHIAKKISATFSSTGTPSYFIHPGESSHGDLGAIASGDCIIILSNSGETRELVNIISYCKRFSIAIIGIAKVSSSTLAQVSDIFLQLPNVDEACPLGLAPTTSTTASLALGDALAVAVMKKKGFTAEKFKIYHPGGKLGAKLLRIKDLMKTPPGLPLVNPQTPMSEALLVMSEKSFGIVGIVDIHNNLLGVITDGDLRRNIHDLLSKKVSEVMTLAPKYISEESLAEEALESIDKNKITSIFVTKEKKVVGLIHILDLIKAGLGI